MNVSLDCTVTELMDQALKKLQTTRREYVLRVSDKLEFIFEDHPLNQYKVRHNARKVLQSSNCIFLGFLLLIWQKNKLKQKQCQTLLRL